MTHARTDSPAGNRASTTEDALRDLARSITLGLPAEGVAVLRRAGDGGDTFEIVALSPEGDRAQPAWLAVAQRLAIDACSGSMRTRIESLDAPGALYDPLGTRQVMVAPALTRGGRAWAALAVCVRCPAQRLDEHRVRLELMRGTLEAIELAGALRGRERDIDRFALVVESASAVGEHEGFFGSAFALCNDLASRFACDRVSVGFTRGASVRCWAMSHTEKLAKGTPLISDIEMAMEEALDQDCEVASPAGPLRETGAVHRAADDLRQRQGSAAVLTVPLRVRGRAVGAITLERVARSGAGEPFAPQHIEGVRLIADLVAPRLAQLHETDRSPLAAPLALLRRAFAALLGKKHTWLKLAALAGAIALAALLLIPGTYRVDGQFRTQALVRRAVPAPIDGFLASVSVELNDTVRAGESVLAQLDDSDLRLELSAEEAKRTGAIKKAAKLRTDRNEAEAQVADAEARESEARIDLLRDRIARSRLVAPVDGVVVVGDLAKIIGTPVRTGDSLFEIAQLESLRAEIDVPEDQIADVVVGQRGELATQSFPGQRVGFTVERIEPVARLVGERNVFRVRAALDERPSWMRPGMEGVARIDAGRRPLGVIWSRRLVNWVRMKLWI